VQSAILRLHVVRLSVRSKIISRSNSLRYLFKLTPTWAIWCNGDTPKMGWNRGRLRIEKACNISETVQDSINRKSHTSFRLVPKSMTLDDLEQPKRHSCRNKKSFTEPTRKITSKINPDKLIGLHFAADNIALLRFQEIEEMSRKWRN